MAGRGGLHSEPPAAALGGERQHFCHPGDDGLFPTLHFREERCKLFCKNLPWLQRRGRQEKLDWGSSTIGAKYIRKKYLVLLIGYKQ